MMIPFVRPARLIAPLALSACAFSGWVGHADPPSIFDASRERLTTSRTMLLSVLPGRWSIDFENRIITGDLKGPRREAYRVLFDDGELWLHHDVDSQVPVQLPTITAQRVGQVFDALRAGATVFTFVEASPVELDPTWVPIEPRNPGFTYRVETPWTWDDDYRAYVTMHGKVGDGYLNALSIWHIVDAKPLQVLGQELDNLYVGLTTATRDVPLDPRTRLPEVQDDWVHLFPGKRGMVIYNPWTNPRYHDEIRRLWLEPSAASTTDTNRQLFPYGCAAAGASDVHNHQIEWRVPPSELPRLQAARASCDTIRFTAGLFASISSHAGQESCLTGDWSVLNFATTPPTVLSSEVVATCDGDPNIRAGETQYFAVDQLVPPTADLAELGLRWQGEYRFDCSAPMATTDTVGTIGTNFQSGGPFPNERLRPAVPLLEWDCWPGWDTPQ